MRTRLTDRLIAVLPEGRLLPDEVWRRRHTIIVRVALAQAVVLGGVAPLRGEHPLAALVEALVVAAPLAVALLPSPSGGRAIRAAAATLSLMAGCVLFVYLMDGLTEAHFLFFVMVGLVSLYQDWVPFGVALSVVLTHHGLFGALFPHSVFGHADAHANPWLWAGVHGAFVLAASLAHLAAWRLNEQQGLTDPLTGLANRTLLVENADRLLADTAPISVLLVDIDDFKDVNDARGHALGDQLLVAVGERLRGCVHPGDVIARLGGDEFAVVVAAGPDAARGVGERMLQAMADPVLVAGRPLGVHVSIGLADTGSAGERNALTLLRNADLAMYLAKAAGGNRLVRYADGMAQAARTKVELLQDLAGAAAAGQLAVHYQPTIALDDGRTTGFEALLRWHHPTRGLVPPAEFVPLAEEGGHIVGIGRWVLGEATRQAAEWSRRAGRPIGIAVNLSPRQLADDDVVDAVGRALRDSGLPAGQLTLEVTEGVLVRDVDAVVEQLHALRALGVRIAIDDFGTGYSSLSYLRRLPADIVKIDRSFVHDLGTGGGSTTLVASIVELARSLRLEVVAEGVETPAQRQLLETLACSHAQGYLFGRPAPAEEHDPTAAAAPRIPVPSV
ncbi:bifunctional diguanylate cyclase/phosphodiesterase [Geodermatophilus sp. YIM 151500]|uniref:putative bifunctional diguanylate cyclase/phosphodiesterase n=1 Tax=Geodermatophilus sp. YIM 151500 TaxID=2984531 RepID=UPI0021E4E64A|nr:bifunctional diguanylate cyclase/phosphodiesterase [Geodermatophilus sp. YIM 151500]MCV2490883.1 bifunctional diguanylate cyclase/phosphodiesterase [Geodermatophilus sp. YIM 151500]